MLLALLACTPEQVVGDSPGPDSRLVDSGLDSEPPPGEPPVAGEALCPRGMSHVPAPIRPFCIDTYEVQLDEAELPRSLAGVLPSTAVSFREAQAACARRGRHLATSREWEDAADGQPGLGGQLYVYGDLYEGALCVEPEGGWTELQPTGSLESCVSPFGTYDQTGNAWEWVDPQIALDARASLELAWSERLVEGEGLALEVVGSLSSARIEAAGWSGELLADEEGLLWLEVSHVGPGVVGYLADNQSLDEPRTWLPIRLEGEGERVQVLLGAERDGDPMTDKRGGSYYSGGEEASRIHATNFNHDADFEGSIGFRCALEL